MKLRDKGVNTMYMIKNRSDAGNKLAEKLTDIVKGEESIVLAIPRGGIVVGNEISKKAKLSP